MTSKRLTDAIAKRRAVQEVVPDPRMHPIAYGLREGAPRIERAEAVAAIRKALEEADGVIVTAAKALGCGRATLFRWLDQADDLRDFAAKLRIRAKKPGRKYT